MTSTQTATKEENTHTLPTDPAVLEALKGGISEIGNSMTRIAGERTYIKESIKAIAEKTNVDKKVIRSMAKIHFKDEMKKKLEEVGDLAELYQRVFKVKIDDEDDSEE